MKALAIGLVLFAGIAQAQDVKVTVGKSYVIPYVVNYPGASGIGIQVNATHDAGLSLGLATNVVLPSDSAAGNYAGYADHFNEADGRYYFVALAYGFPAESGILPIRVLARRAGEYELKVRQCSINVNEHTKADCVLSTTRVVAEDIVR